MKLIFQLFIPLILLVSPLVFSQHELKGEGQLWWLMPTSEGMVSASWIADHQLRIKLNTLGTYQVLYEGPSSLLTVNHQWLSEIEFHKWPSFSSIIAWPRKGFGEFSSSFWYPSSIQWQNLKGETIPIQIDQWQYSTRIKRWIIRPLVPGISSTQFSEQSQNIIDKHDERLIWPISKNQYWIQDYKGRWYGENWKKNNFRSLPSIVLAEDKKSLYVPQIERNLTSLWTALKDKIISINIVKISKSTTKQHVLGRYKATITLHQI